MATKNNEEPKTGIENLNDSLTKAEQRVEKNKKLIMWICIAAAAVVALVLIYIYAIYKPGVNNANTEYGKASNKEFMLQAQPSDSARIAAEKDVLKSFEAAATKGHDGGNNATLMAAVHNYKAGDYNKALKYLQDYDRKDKVIGTTSKALEGDCYVNLKQYDKAIDCYKEAIDIAEQNPELVPYCMLKEAVVYRHLKKYTEEADIYKQLLEQYPQYGESHNIDFKAALSRAQSSK
ncbi:MAG: tetratricopeptide repeat protein [Paramuribaculum sp.]|mgnify:FL=1